MNKISKADLKIATELMVFYSQKAQEDNPTDAACASKCSPEEYRRVARLLSEKSLLRNTSTSYAMRSLRGDQYLIDNFHHKTTDRQSAKKLISSLFKVESLWGRFWDFLKEVQDRRTIIWLLIISFFVLLFLIVALVG